MPSLRTTHPDWGIARRFPRRVTWLGSGAFASAPVIQHHLDRGDLGDGDLTFIVRDGAFVAFARSDLQRLTGNEVIHAVLAGVGPEASTLYVSGLSCAHDSYQLDLVSEIVSEQVAPGDIVQAGLRVTHSLIAEHATVVESFVLRLVCENGLTHREHASAKAFRTRRLPAGHPDARRLQIAQVDRLAAQAWGTLRRKLQAMQTLRDEQVDVPRFLSQWVRRARLSSRHLLPLLLRAWEEEGAESNAYSALNAMTRVATHHMDLPLRQRRTLSALAGVIAFRSIHLCPRCLSVLTDSQARATDRDEAEQPLIEDSLSLAGTH